jgi:hypothetical protein
LEVPLDGPERIVVKNGHALALNNLF